MCLFKPLDDWVILAQNIYWSHWTVLKHIYTRSAPWSCNVLWLRSMVYEYGNDKRRWPGVSGSHTESHLGPNYAHRTSEQSQGPSEQAVQLSELNTIRFLWFVPIFYTQTPSYITIIQFSTASVCRIDEPTIRCVKSWEATSFQQRKFPSIICLPCAFALSAIFMRPNFSARKQWQHELYVTPWGRPLLPRGLIECRTTNTEIRMHKWVLVVVFLFLDFQTVVWIKNRPLLGTQKATAVRSNVIGADFFNIDEEVYKWSKLPLVYLRLAWTLQCSQKEKIGPWLVSTGLASHNPFP